MSPSLSSSRLRDSSKREAKLSSPSIPLPVPETDVDIETMKILWRFLRHMVRSGPSARATPVARDTSFWLHWLRPFGAMKSGGTYRSCASLSTSPKPEGLEVGHHPVDDLVGADPLGVDEHR